MKGVSHRENKNTLHTQGSSQRTVSERISIKNGYPEGWPTFLRMMVITPLLRGLLVSAKCEKGHGPEGCHCHAPHWVPPDRTPVAVPSGSCRWLTAPTRSFGLPFDGETGTVLLVPSVGRATAAVRIAQRKAPECFSPHSGMFLLLCTQFLNQSCSKGETDTKFLLCPGKYTRYNEIYVEVHPTSDAPKFSYL